MTRRDALKLVSMAAVGAWVEGFSLTGASAAPAGPERFQLGVASVSLPKFSSEQVIAALHQLGIHNVSLFKTHCPWSGTAAECRAAARKFTDAGLTVTGSGVIALPNDETAVRKAFENARAAGLPTMVCQPALDAYPLIEKYVRQYDLRLAVHNHGPGDKVYPSPYDAWKAVQPYDSRIGLCIDVGHAWRAGTDPAEAIVKCRERLYDVHLKDSLAEPGAVKDIPAVVGQGHMDIKGILAALIQVKYSRIVAFEYEKHGGDPVAGLGESIAYVKKVLTEKAG